MRAASTFQEGQLALEMLADGLKLEPFALAEVSHYILEPLEDVLTEMTRDVMAENRGRAARDDMDRDDDELQHVPSALDENTLMGKHRAKFGDEVSQSVESPGLAAIFGVGRNPGESRTQDA
jgi:hypothetical protein